MRKIALVTGSSRGIGRAIALSLASDGYDIFVHYNKSRSKALTVKKEIEKIGSSAYVLKADLTKEKEVAKLFGMISSVTDQLDLLINNAGSDDGKTFEEYKLSEMKQIIDIILWSKFLTAKAALPLLKKSTTPNIINIASRMGKEKTIIGISPYGSAEAGIIKFTQCLALELAPYKIRCNCIAPGLTKTAMSEAVILRDEGSEEKAEEFWNLMAKTNPSGRVGKPEDIANVVSFLASDKSFYINGETIGVNGGSNLG